MPCSDVVCLRCVLLRIVCISAALEELAATKIQSRVRGKKARQGLGTNIVHVYASLGFDVPNGH